MVRSEMNMDAGSGKIILGPLEEGLVHFKLWVKNKKIEAYKLKY